MNTKTIVIRSLVWLLLSLSLQKFEIKIHTIWLLMFHLVTHSWFLFIGNPLPSFANSLELSLRPTMKMNPLTMFLLPPRKYLEAFQTERVENSLQMRLLMTLQNTIYTRVKKLHLHNLIHKEVGHLLNIIFCKRWLLIGILFSRT